MDFKQLYAMSTDTPPPMHAGPVTADYANGYFKVSIGHLEADRMRLVLGSRYHRGTDLWITPATRSQAAALRGLFGERLDLTPAAQDRIDFLFRRRDDAYMMEAYSDHLFPFQRDGVRFLRTAGSALLGDSMGTGKTIQAIEWMRLNAGGVGARHLVVCPNSMKYKWASEIEQWWPEATPVVIDGTAGQRRKQIASGDDLPAPLVYVINYESLRAHTRLKSWGGKALTEKQKEEKELNKYLWQCVVVDEAHKIKDPKAQQTMAVKQMGAQAAHRLALTGTPLMNNPDDVWSIMNFVEPDEWGSRNQFRNRYCLMQNAWHGGFENTGLKPGTRAEFDQFFQPRFLRRTKEEVLPDLPEKFDIDYRVLPMTTGQAKLYKAMVKDMMALTGDDLLMAENPLSLMIRLRQIACASLVVENGEVVALEKPSNKLDAIKDILAEAPGEPLVVYAESRKFIEFLFMELCEDHRIGLVTGAQGSAVRGKAVENFQNGQLDIILGTLGAGAEGLTLTRANRIVLAQQSWSHATNSQAIDRVHRIGQDRGVQPIVLVSKGTIDEATAMVDKTKEARLQDLVRDPAWLRKAMVGDV